jgi:hypothetical protein
MWGFARFWFNATLRVLVSIHWLLDKDRARSVLSARKAIRERPVVKDLCRRCKAHVPVQKLLAEEHDDLGREVAARTFGARGFLDTQAATREFSQQRTLHRAWHRPLLESGSANVGCPVIVDLLATVLLLRYFLPACSWISKQAQAKSPTR